MSKDINNNLTLDINNNHNPLGFLDDDVLFGNIDEPLPQEPQEPKQPIKYSEALGMNEKAYADWLIESKREREELYKKMDEEKDKPKVSLQERLKQLREQHNQQNNQ